LLKVGVLVGGLLGARCAFAQAPPSSAQASPAPLPIAQQLSSPPVTEAPPAPRPFRLGERLRNLFSPRSADKGVQQATDLQATGMKAPAPLPKGITELSAKELEKVGHEQDYSWITGKLFRIDGGQWVLRYAGPYEVDRYSGGVLLTAHADLANYRPGDLVCVLGRVAATTRDAKMGAGATYQISTINLIERGSR